MVSKRPTIVDEKRTTNMITWYPADAAKAARGNIEGRRAQSTRPHRQQLGRTRTRDRERNCPVTRSLRLVGAGRSAQHNLRYAAEGQWHKIDGDFPS